MKKRHILKKNKHHKMPKKQRKFYKFIGIGALLIAIVAVGVLSQGGDMFRGTVFHSPVMKIYVKKHLSGYDCDIANAPRGSQNCPFTSISEAIDAANSYEGDGVGIYLDKDVYNTNENPIKLEDKYFEFNGNGSRLNGRIEAKNIEGTIEGLSFIQSGYIKGALIDIDNSNSNHKSLILSDIHMSNVIGESLINFEANNYNNEFTVQDSYFHRANATDSSIINIEGEVIGTVQRNIFSESGSVDGLIYANSGLIAVNNLFFDTLSNTPACIQLGAGWDSLIANNTFFKNRVSKANVWQLGEGGSRIYNNLVTAASTAFDVSDATYSIARNNSITYSLEEDGLDPNKNDPCNPKFTVHSNEYDPTYYNLGAGSTCINAGYSNVVTKNVANTDYYGNERTGQPDIGFHEYQMVFTPMIMQYQFVYIPPADDGGTTTNGGTTDDNNGSSANGGTNNGSGVVITIQDDDDFILETEDTSRFDEDNLVASLSEEDDDDLEVELEEEQVDCGDWDDIDDDDDEYEIWIYLCERDIVYGHSDGTLRPEDLLTRSELLALAFRASDYKNIYEVNEDADYCFSDIDDEWFAKYFCTAEDEGFVEGYDNNLAKPAKYVILAEGLKMFLGALGESYTINPNPNNWYYDMLHEAEDNNWLPYKLTSESAVGPVQLTRRKAFNMLYRIMVY